MNSNQILILFTNNNELITASRDISGIIKHIHDLKPLGQCDITLKPNYDKITVDVDYSIDTEKPFKGYIKLTKLIDKVSTIDI